jgi:hypothetical protein
VAISSHGTTFAFSGIAGLTGSVLSISVEEAQPEIVDMTAVTDDIAVRRLMTTGDIVTPPKVSIEYLRSADNLYVHPLMNTPAGAYGLLTIAHGPSVSTVARFACVESASTELAVGDLVRGKLTFVVDTTIS